MYYVIYTHTYSLSNPNENYMWLRHFALETALCKSNLSAVVSVFDFFRDVISSSICHASPDPIGSRQRMAEMGDKTNSTLYLNCATCRLWTRYIMESLMTWILLSFPPLLKKEDKRSAKAIRNETRDNNFSSFHMENQFWNYWDPVVTSLFPTEIGEIFSLCVIC